MNYDPDDLKKTYKFIEDISIMTQEYFKYLYLNKIDIDPLDLLVFKIANIKYKLIKKLLYYFNFLYITSNYKEYIDTINEKSSKNKKSLINLMSQKDIQ